MIRLRTKMLADKINLQIINNENANTKIKHLYLDSLTSRDRNYEI